MPLLADACREKAFFKSWSCTNIHVAHAGSSGHARAAVDLTVIDHLQLLVLGLVCIPGPATFNIVRIYSVIDEARLVQQWCTCGAIHRPDATQYAISRACHHPTMLHCSTAAAAAAADMEYCYQEAQWGEQEQDTLHHKRRSGTSKSKTCFDHPHHQQIP